MPIYVFIHNNSQRVEDNDLNHFSGIGPRSPTIPIDLALLQDPTEHDHQDPDDAQDDDDDCVIYIGDISVRDSSKATKAKLDAFRFAGLTMVELASMPPPKTYTEARRAPDAK